MVSSVHGGRDQKDNPFLLHSSSCAYPLILHGIMDPRSYRPLRNDGVGVPPNLPLKATNHLSIQACNPASTSSEAVPRSHEERLLEHARRLILPCDDPHSSMSFLRCPAQVSVRLGPNSC